MLPVLGIVMSAPSYWVVGPSGINWEIGSESAHVDTIEASGEECSLILTYGMEDGRLLVRKPHVVWPMLRTLPNDTHASLQHTFSPDEIPMLTVGGKSIAERLDLVALDGRITTETTAEPVSVVRTWFPARRLPMAIERISVRNDGSAPVVVALTPTFKRITTDAAKGVNGAYTIEAVPWQGEASPLPAGQSREMAIYYTARSEKQPLVFPKSPAIEEGRRVAMVKELDGLLDLQTPDPAVDRMFRFAKLRAAESLFRTLGGLVHSPGGGDYYAAIWANDQAEYANPLFGYLGYAPAYEAAETSFDWFSRFTNPEFRPIPSSIIAEGTSFWNGAGDRGDMAMIAYGASRYALARGDRGKALRLWPLIGWCLDYLERKRSPEGVIFSDSDELEGRFPAGKANLNTSCLAYDALLSAASLADDLRELEKASLYRTRATELRKAIGDYFASQVEGFPTYGYYEGNDVLRAWIATPLTVGIFDRAPGTLDALFSPRLWTADGLASQAGDATFWDRATLYGFRGAFAAGATERALPRFLAYTNRRLTGDHVPYAVEAYPEGNQRHLSAESALYIRVVTEGLFGLRPTGLRSFQLDPHLPQAWNEMALRRISIAGTVVSVRVDRSGCKVSALGRTPKRFPLGQPISLDLDEPW